jgi:uncharacterized protein (DUF885 family)
MPNRILAELADDYWDVFLTAHPVQGTALGDHRYSDRLEPVTDDERDALDRRLATLADRVAGVDAAGLSAEERLTLASLRHGVGSDRALLSADPLSYTVDAMSGPQVGFLNIPSLQPVGSQADGVALLSRWRAMGPWLDEAIARLRAGMRAGLSPIRVSVDRVIAELDETLDRPVADWPLSEPARAPHDGWPEAAFAGFADEVLEVVSHEIRPAFARYRAFLADEARAVARDEAHAGIANLPGGPERYAALVGVHTTTGRTPEQIHAIGLEEIDRIDAELAELGSRVLGTRDLTATLAALRGDPALFFDTSEAVQAVAERCLRAAEAAVPAWFGRVPRTPCEVVPMPRHEQEHSTIAYYREPAVGGGRPGRYYINTWAPETRPRYEAEALAFHESVPGHHLQIAIGQELAELPTFRRHAEVTAFIEGWGLYSERLADEMGLYTADLDRIGMLSFDAWRACRLVVDTGMHALGWSRSAAIEFMTEHSALAPNNIANEVDRYLGWPGQALAYKIGQLEQRRLRADAEAALGAAFDVRAFHDALLGHGALPLGVLRAAVAADLGFETGA